jgi:hypothetical protein
MEGLSIAGDGAEWAVFTRQTMDGKPVVVRSRAARQELKDFAASNIMARLRCIPSDGQVNDAGMPLIIEILDDYEDTLISQLESTKAVAYEIAVVTGAGCRDLFFAIAHKEELSDAIEKIRASRPFKLQVGWLEGPKEKLLESLAP